MSPGHRDIAVDRDGRVRDQSGQTMPSRLNWLKLVRAIPAFVSGENRAFKRRVPDDFYTNDVDGDEPIVVVSCPCGEAPRVPVGACVECSCQRFYLATGRAVLVANSPQDREDEPEGDAATERATGVVN